MTPFTFPVSNCGAQFLILKEFDTALAKSGIVCCRTQAQLRGARAELGDVEPPALDPFQDNKRAGSSNSDARLNIRIEDSKGRRRSRNRECPRFENRRKKP